MVVEFDDLFKYYLTSNLEKFPHCFHIYWSPVKSLKIYLGRCWYCVGKPREKNQYGQWMARRDWFFEFEESAPHFIRERIIQNSEMPGGNANPSLDIENVELDSYLDLYELLSLYIKPPHDEGEGMKNFYKNFYALVREPDLKKLIKNTITEWSKAEYYISKECQYILKEIEEKEGKI